jgi:hypothetical protein
MSKSKEKGRRVCEKPKTNFLCETVGQCIKIQTFLLIKRAVKISFGFQHCIVFNSEKKSSLLQWQDIVMQILSSLQPVVQ